MMLTIALSVRAADSVSCSLWCPMTCPDSELSRPVLYCLSGSADGFGTSCLEERHAAMNSLTPVPGAASSSLGRTIHGTGKPSGADPITP